MDAEYELRAKQIERNVRMQELSDEELWQNDELQELQRQIDELQAQVDDSH